MGRLGLPKIDVRLGLIVQDFGVYESRCGELGPGLTFEITIGLLHRRLSIQVKMNHDQRRSTALQKYEKPSRSRGVGVRPYILHPV